MSVSVVLPEGYRYIAAGLVSTAWVLAWQTTVVARYRKKSGIRYPQLYAEKAEAQASKDAHLFNCAQRAHQNTLENIPVVLVATMVSGLKYPVLAAGACAFWSFTRILYTIGYTTGDVDKRNKFGGFLGGLSAIGLIFVSTYVAYQLSACA